MIQEEEGGAEGGESERMMSPETDNGGRSGAFISTAFRKTRSVNRRGGKRLNRYFKTIISDRFTEKNIKTNGEKVRKRNRRSRKGKKKEGEGGC